MVAMMVESIILVIVLCLIFIILSLKVEKSENMISSYECGFDSQFGSRLGFSYRFFLLSILFLVFDVEISLLLPLPYLSFDSFIVMMGGFFMGILLVGLVYEYYMGVLSWSF